MKLPRPPAGFHHVPGFPGYAVSRAGKVISCRQAGRRSHANRFSAPWHLMQLTPYRVKRRGCSYIGVSLCTDAGAIRRRYVHQLVLITFRGPCPAGHECCHKNGVSTENRLRNLRWGTPESNRKDQLRHGTNARGERVGSAKLTERSVRAILTSTEMGLVLAKRYHVHKATISDIRTGKTWKHIPRRPRT